MKVGVITNSWGIQLQNNNLTEIPVEWGRWEGLKSLTLEGNLLRRYPLGKGVDLLFSMNDARWSHGIRQINYPLCFFFIV